MEQLTDDSTLVDQIQKANIDDETKLLAFAEIDLMDRHPDRYPENPLLRDYPLGMAFTWAKTALGDLFWRAIYTTTYS